MRRLIAPVALLLAPVLAGAQSGGFIRYHAPSGGGTASIRSHATDCTALVDGATNEVCLELDSERFFTCQPTAGGCDTPAEWILTPNPGAPAFPLAAGTGCVTPDYSFTADSNAGLCLVVVDQVRVQSGAGNGNGYLLATVGSSEIGLLDGVGVASKIVVAPDLVTFTLADGVAGSFSTARRPVVMLTGTAAPSATDCDASGEVSPPRFYHQNGDPADVNAQLFRCIQTGAASFAWHPVGHMNGTAPPQACTQGNLFFDTDAVAGTNWFGCTTTGDPGTWTQLGGGFATPGAGIIVDTNGSGSLAARCVVPGDGTVVTNGCGAAGNITVGSDTATTPQYTQGLGSPPATCAVGQVYAETDQLRACICSATDTWTCNGKLRAHATDCTGLTDGIADEMCFERDANTLYVCEPSAGGCDTAGEWTSASGGGTPTLFTARTTFGSAVDAANAIDFNETAGSITVEGATADGFETRLFWSDPSADRGLTFPNASGNVMVDTVSHTVSGNNTFSGQMIVSDSTGEFRLGASAKLSLRSRTTMTPDQGTIEPSTTSNSLHMVEGADGAFDFNNGPCGTAACTNPQFIVADKDQNITDYQAIGLSGLTGKFVKTLTETTATSVVIIPVSAATSVSGMMFYTVHARDGTNSQTRSGRVIWNGVAEGTTATCVLGTADELDNTPTGTLTATITCTSPANNQIQLLIDATSSLTQTTLEAYVTLISVGPGEPLPQ